MNFGIAMEREMREQPSILAKNEDRYFVELQRAVGQIKPSLVVLVARGSSDHAALYARYLIEVCLGIPVSLAAPSVLTRYGSKIRYPNCLAVGISQSGAAPDVSEVLAHLSEQGHATLAITNTSGSRIASSASHSLILEAGEEKSIAATKTYTSSLLAMYQLVRALGANLPCPSQLLPTDEFMDLSREAAELSLGPILRCHPVFCLARGYDFSTAQETSLKLMECALIPAKAYSSADFQHGPKALVTAQAATISFGEVSGVAELPSVKVSSPSLNNVPEQVAPIWNIIFGQWLALLAARARGLDPDSVESLNKVTKTL